MITISLRIPIFCFLYFLNFWHLLEKSFDFSEMPARKQPETRLWLQMCALQDFHTSEHMHNLHHIKRFFVPKQTTVAAADSVNVKRSARVKKERKKESLWDICWVTGDETSFNGFHKTTDAGFSWDTPHNEHLGAGNKDGGSGSLKPLTNRERWKGDSYLWKASKTNDHGCRTRAFNILMNVGWMKMSWFHTRTSFRSASHHIKGPIFHIFHAFSLGSIYGIYLCDRINKDSQD